MVVEPLCFTTLTSCCTFLLPATLVTVVVVTLVTVLPDADVDDMISVSCVVVTFDAS